MGSLEATEALGAPDPRNPHRGADWPWLLRADGFDELVRARAAQTPDALLLVDEHDERISCSEFDARLSRVAAALSAQGIGAGSRVAWQLPTRLSTMLVLGALRRLGAVQAPIIPLYRDREVSAALATSEAEFFLTPGEWNGYDFAAMADRIRQADGPAPTLLAIGHEAPGPADGDSPAPADTAASAGDSDAVRWIYFTSGSTGAPKGARHTDESLLAAAEAFAGIGRLGSQPDEVAAMGFPVAHVGGVVYFAAALAAGFPILLLESFVPPSAVELFRRHGVTTTGGAPPFYTALLAMARQTPDERLLPLLRSLKGGGAPCPPELAHAVQAELGAVLAHDYGMTECPMVAVGCPDDPVDERADSDGWPIPANELRLVAVAGQSREPGDASQVGEICQVGQVGQVGEVQVRGKAVCRGYTDPAETATAFTDDGWFRTGDLGRIRASGQLEVVGRTKDLIIRKGENIAPLEIEELLGRHPDVAEVAVIGLHDDERGERVCAVVVPRTAAKPTLAELAAWLTEAGLMRHKHPEQLEIVDELPRTGLAKVAKSALRERFANSR